jgi:L-iditol 2-dehydrogenase
MKAAVHTSPGVIEIQEVAEPVPGPGEIKVRIEYTGICGSDVEIVNNHFGKQKLDSWPKGPKIEGHEACGTVVEIGPNLRHGFKAGDRVALGLGESCGGCYSCRNGLEHFCDVWKPCPGTWAQYGAFPEGAAYALPEGLPLQMGALAEPVSIAIRLVDVAGVKTGQSLLIAGAGTIGLLSLAVARQAGATTRVVSEPRAHKRQLALDHGATAAVDPLAEPLYSAAERLTNGRGFNSVLEASGNLGSAKAVLNAVANHGTVVWAGVYPDDAEVAVNPYQMYEKDITLKGSWIAPYSFYRGLEFLQAYDLSYIVTDVHPLEKTQEAFDHHLEGNSIKTLLQCWN